jgi:hypothetical protein
MHSQGAPVSSINKTDRHDITEILLKVALNTITLILKFYIRIIYIFLLIHMKFDINVLFTFIIS